MEHNQIGAVLLPSRIASPDHPGHMFVRFLHPNGEIANRGFRFSPDDLPVEFRPAIRLRDFLFVNRVPGYVVDDSVFAMKCQAFSQYVISRDWAINRFEVVEQLKPTEMTRHGWYSFNPHSFPDCHNCVSWAVDTINCVVDEAVLTCPRQGRVKEMKNILEASA